MAVCRREFNAGNIRGKFVAAALAGPGGKKINARHAQYFHLANILDRRFNFNPLKLDNKRFFVRL
jgi:hypothetical protein